MPVSRAAVRRSMRAAQYQEMKRESFLDTAVVGALGTPLAYFNSGPDAAVGLVMGAAAGALYHLLLQRDVDNLAPGSTPFDLFNPLRVVRFLLPVLLVGVLCLQAALSVGPEAWLASLTWSPGANFVGFVSARALSAALLGYVASTASLQLRGIARAVPEARTLVKAMPGSLGVAVKLKEDYEKKRRGAAAPVVTPARQVPVLLISGPRGCGKSTLAQSLAEGDGRFMEPEWVASAAGGAIGGKQIRQVIDQESFEKLEKSGSLAASYKPYSEEGEQLSIGLPAVGVISAALEAEACLLDVDPPTARSLLSYNWDRALAAASPDERLELRIVAAWVSLPSLDHIVDRNRQSMKASGLNSGLVERQLAALRSQASHDTEWALTSGAFDFTVLNERREDALREVKRAAGYCFEDPF